MALLSEKSDAVSVRSTSTSSSLKSLFKKDKTPHVETAEKKNKEVAEKAVHREAMYTYMSMSFVESFINTLINIINIETFFITTKRNPQSLPPSKLIAEVHISQFHLIVSDVLDPGCSPLGVRYVTRQPDRETFVAPLICLEITNMSRRLPTPYNPPPSSLRKPSPQLQSHRVASKKQRERLQTESPDRSATPAQYSITGMSTNGKAVSTSQSNKFRPFPNSASPTGGILDHHEIVSFENESYEDEEDYYDEDGIPIGPVPSSHSQPSRKRKAPALGDDDNDSILGPDDTPDVIPINGFNRAHNLKMALQPNPNIPDAGFKKRSVEKDPENHMIKRLRCDENLGWGVIAEILNGERVKQGGDPSWTSAGVYGRFVRNAPRIAQMQGEAFDYKDYVNVKGKKDMKAKKEATPLPRLSESNQVMLVEAYGEVQAAFWDHVADSLRVKSGRNISGDDCARLFQLI